MRLAPQFLFEREENLDDLLSFRKGFDAFSAQSFAHLAAINKKGHPLKIGLKRPIRCAHGKRAPVSKGGRLTAVLTLRHGSQSFPRPDGISKSEFYHIPHLFSTSPVKLIKTKRKGGQR